MLSTSKVYTQRADGTFRVQSVCEGESLTKQSFADECDIQNIVKKALRGQPVTASTVDPKFIDLTILPDYETSLQNVATLNNKFSTLDAITRRNFGNDPLNLVNFLSNPANHKAAVQLGLLDASALPPAQPLPEAAPAASPAP